MTNNLSHEQLGWAEASEAVSEPNIWRFAEDLSGMGFQQGFITKVDPGTGEVKKREIWKPNQPMRALHQRFLEHLRSLEVELPYSTGGRPGNSPAVHIEPHRDNQYFYLVDLKSAYDQVPVEPLTKILFELDPSLGSPEAIAEFLKRFCIHPRGRGLRTGAPTSPELFNLFLAPLDDELGEFCRQNNITYTRYLDDLCFSAPEPNDRLHGQLGKRNRSNLLGFVKRYGLKINYRKSQVSKLEDGPVIITGLQLNPNGKWQLSSHYQKYVERELWILNNYLNGIEPFSDEQRDHFAGLKGVVMNSFDPSRAVSTNIERRLISKCILITNRNQAIKRGQEGWRVTEGQE